jgi:hypothetical protein
MGTYIEKFKFNEYHPEEKQERVFKRTVQQYLERLNPNEAFKSEQEPIYNEKPILITFEKMKELTKAPSALINKLIKQKMLVKTETENVYAVNETKVFCKDCQQDEVEDYHLKLDNSSYEHKIYDASFYEWEIAEHLRSSKHGIGKELNDKYVWVNIPISEEQINKYIVYEKPEFKVHQHSFKVTEIDNSRLNKVYVRLVCERCGYDTGDYRITESVPVCTEAVSK